MKIAICGAGPLGIEMAACIEKMGGSYRIFSPHRPGGSILRMLEQDPNQTMGHSWGEITGSSSFEGGEGGGGEGDKGGPNFSDKIPTVKEYWENYLQPLIQNSQIEKNFKKARVQRVHKRFLQLDEEVPGKSRLQDLFRVVYCLNPEGDLREQMEENPAVFEKLGHEVVDSLKESVELFEDFDMVINATGVLQNPLPMGPSNSPAIGELQQRNSGKISYLTPYTSPRNFSRDEFQQIAIVGSGTCAALALINWAGWCLEGGNRSISLVSNEEVPFQKLRSIAELGGASQDLIKELDQVCAQMEEVGRQNHLKYQVELEKWQELDDFIKVKVKRPVAPVGKLVQYAGANVTAVDQLIDRKGIYLTLEWPTFRKTMGDEKNLVNHILTINVDWVGVATGFSINLPPFENLRTAHRYDRKTTVSQDGSHPEVGFFTLGPVFKSGYTGYNGGDNRQDRYNLKEGLSQIPVLKERILAYFTRA